MHKKNKGKNSKEAHDCKVTTKTEPTTKRNKMTTETQTSQQTNQKEKKKMESTKGRFMALRLICIH